MEISALKHMWGLRCHAAPKLLAKRRRHSFSEATQGFSRSVSFFSDFLARFHLSCRPRPSTSPARSPSPSPFLEFGGAVLPALVLGSSAEFVVFGSYVVRRHLPRPPARPVQGRRQRGGELRWLQSCLEETRRGAAPRLSPLVLVQPFILKRLLLLLSQFQRPRLLHQGERASPEGTEKLVRRRCFFPVEILHFRFPSKFFPPGITFLSGTFASLSCFRSVFQDSRNFSGSIPRCSPRVFFFMSLSTHFN